MTRLEHTLRLRIDRALESGVSLRSITRAAGVPYHAVYSWVRGRTRSITVGTADALLKALTGRGIGS